MDVRVGEPIRFLAIAVEGFWESQSIVVLEPAPRAYIAGHTLRSALEDVAILGTLLGEFPADQESVTRQGWDLAELRARAEERSDNVMEVWVEFYTDDRGLLASRLAEGK